jgi:hypothetical protein
MVQKVMLDSEFDPYQALVNLDANVKAVITAHNALAKRVEEQGHVIDILTEGLSAANKANEIMMKDMLSNINEQLKEVK